MDTNRPKNSANPRDLKAVRDSSAAFARLKKQKGPVGRRTGLHPYTSPRVKGDHQRSQATHFEPSASERESVDREVKPLLINSYANYGWWFSRIKRRRIGVPLLRVGLDVPHADWHVRISSWRSTAPANDWQIFHQGWETHWQDGAPRHAADADHYRGLIFWMRRPEGILESEAKPPAVVDVTTNWRVDPDYWLTASANDNEELDPGEEENRSLLEFFPEASRECRPSYKVVAEASKAFGEGDIERNMWGQIVRIGGMRFAGGYSRPDDTPTKRVTVREGGRVVTKAARLRVGEWIGRDEASPAQPGASPNLEQVRESNKFFAAVLGTEPARHIPGSRKKRGGRNFSHTKRTEMLAEAYANTPVLPPVKKCPPGLPCGSPYVANSFLGMKKAAGGANSGTQAWEDVSTAMTNREIWAAAVASLAKHDVDTLEFVTSEKARSLEAVGTAAGMSAEYARRKGGKRRLITANDNLLAALKKFAA